MATIPANARTWRRREPRVQLLIWLAWLLAAAVFIACFQFISEKTIWAFVSDAPQQAGDVEITPEKPLTLRYRFVVADGAPDKAELDRLWNDYAHPPIVTVTDK